MTRPTTTTTVNSNKKVLRTIDVDGEEVPSKAYKGERDLGCVNMLEGIQSIGFRSFQGCENIQSLTLPLTTKEVDGYAFCDCRSAKSVKLNDGLERISHRAFMGCMSVVEVEIPATLKFFGKDAFRRCTSLKEARFLGCPGDIKKNVFSECTSLERIMSMSDDTTQIEKMIPKDIPMELVGAKDGWTLVYERVQEEPETNSGSESDPTVVVNELDDSLRLEQAITQAKLAMNSKLTMTMNSKYTRIENECKWLFETIQKQPEDDRKNMYTVAELAEYQRVFERKVGRLRRVTAERDELQRKLSTSPSQV